MKNIQSRILNKNLSYLFSQATIGIEKEGHRILHNGEISTTKHSQKFGNRNIHPYIQTDFAESQLELITPVCKEDDDVWRYLSAIHEIVLRNLNEEEYILPASIPLQLPVENDILEAQMSEKDMRYRQYLSNKYGKYKQMVSGIHYNFGFTTEFFSLLKNDDENLKDIQNEIYMKLARQFTRYQWILVYLFGASIKAPDEYFQKETIRNLNTLVRSIRSSQYGYVNDVTINVSYNSLNDYIETLEQHIEQKKLIAEKEFYSSVRFRGQKVARDFIEHGIQYVELRIFDLNPFEMYGISKKDIRFIHLFVMLMVWLEEDDKFNACSKGTAYKYHVALEHPLHQTKYYDEGQYLFQQLLNMANILQLPQNDIAIIEEKLNQLNYPELTIAGRLCKNEHLDQLYIDLSKTYKKDALDKPFGLTAFSNMELSTQALISDVIQYGIHLEILDESDQFLKLTYQNKVEYVKKGNMSSLDTYISPLIMENKVVTKKILSEYGLRVPNSIQIKSLEEAIFIYPSVKTKAVVIKPKSTNYGLGITIFKNKNINLDDYKLAIQVALKEDNEVMIEDFIEGIEYRFFVLGNETKAVLLRVPANVVGDGKSTVEELISLKNNSILRGDGKTTPLTKIEVGEIETIQLKEQGYTLQSIIPKNTVVYLRANSNISTGGDSIDMTDEVDESYKQIAVAVAKSLGAKICGVDLIIKNIKLPVSSSIDSYGIVEANFNPMMMMHIFPSKGESRRLTTDVLKLLFPEL